MSQALPLDGSVALWIMQYRGGACASYVLRGMHIKKEPSPRSEDNGRMVGGEPSPSRGEARAAQAIAYAYAPVLSTGKAVEDSYHGSAKKRIVHLRRVGRGRKLWKEMSWRCMMRA
jgi:hypothetical protein